jgi:hypothetical protein
MVPINCVYRFSWPNPYIILLSISWINRNGCRYRWRCVMPEDDQKLHLRNAFCVNISCYFFCEDSWSLLTSEIPVFRFRWTCIMWELVYGIHLCRQRGQPTLSIFAEQIGGFGLLQFPGNPVPVALEWRWSASCFLIRDLLQPPTCPFFFVVGCFGLARTKMLL